MATISSISGTQSMTASGLPQMRLQQAKGEVEQAEQTARSLQVEARNAQLRANEAEAKARSIEAQASQAQANVRQARQDLAVVTATSRTGNTADPVAELLKSNPSVASRNSEPPVINTQGQLTGTVVNITA